MAPCCQPRGTLNITGSAEKIVRSTKFLCVHITENLTWYFNTNSIAKRAQQSLYFLRRLKKLVMIQPKQQVRVQHHSKARERLHSQLGSSIFRLTHGNLGDQHTSQQGQRHSDA
ncbi:hypothetical protein NFI96_008063 [Prochilodus magdalenae]|nr:hypothetical protein NFI96_008063 [Prochilodus magdalenae]